MKLEYFLLYRNKCYYSINEKIRYSSFLKHFFFPVYAPEAICQINGRFKLVFDFLTFKSHLGDLQDQDRTVEYWPIQ